MSHQTDTRLDESKTLDMDEVIERLGIDGLRRSGPERIGPCPKCGGTDRFAVNVRNHMANCRRCGLRAGDQVGLVQEILGVGFREALSWLMGNAAVDLDPREVERRRKERQAAADRQEAEAQRYRGFMRQIARDIWRNSATPDAQPMRRYLEQRGFDSDLVERLYETIRFHPNLPYKKKIAGEMTVLHSGPAMVARIDTRASRCSAVHCTWLDGSQDNGKAVITHRMEANKDEPWPSKLVFGSAKGGVIFLTRRKSSVLVMGEGIETTLTALEYGGLDDANFLAGVSLGNMAGRMQRVPGMRHSGLPDLTDDKAFVPWDSVKRLIFLQDGDSDPKATRAKLESGLQRAMYHLPDLHAQIVHAGEGVDLNDLVRPDAQEAAR